MYANPSWLFLGKGGVKNQHVWAWAKGIRDEEGGKNLGGKDFICGMIEGEATREKERRGREWSGTT